MNNATPRTIEIKPLSADQIRKAYIASLISSALVGK